MWSLREWRRRRLLQRTPLPDHEWQTVLAALPLLHGLSADEQRRLRELVILFRHAKSLEAAGGLVLDDTMTLWIAVQACLPILNLGLDYYADWVAVVIYPDRFRVEHKYVDAAGVVHHEQQWRAGEAWERGPLILSWPDVVQATASDGDNVVIHECAHKLDLLTGGANGRPPLHRDMVPDTWSAAFSTAYADLSERLAAGLDSALSPYATTSPGEFFAVASEAFFERPTDLDAAYPAVYQQLCAFYRQDPGRRRA
jgi:Mlc titration factor MtfA (ptsG expression regulator)